MPKFVYLKKNTMKKILFLLLFLPSFLMAQQPVTLTGPTIIRYKNPITNDSIKFSLTGDSAKYYTNQEVNVFNKPIKAPFIYKGNDTVPNWPEIRNYLGTHSSGVTPTSNLLYWNSGLSAYTPYSTQQNGKFDRSASAPVHADSTLNYDGNFKATYGFFTGIYTPSLSGNYSFMNQYGFGMYDSNVPMVNFSPGISDGTIGSSFSFSTKNPISSTNTKLLLIQNNWVDRFSIDKDGNAYKYNNLGVLSDTFATKSDVRTLGGGGITASKGITRNVNNFEIASSSAMNNFTWYRSTFLGSNIDFAAENLLLQSLGSRGGLSYINLVAGSTSYKPSIEIMASGSTSGTGDDFSIDIDSSGITFNNDGNQVAKIDSSGHNYHIGTYAGIYVTDGSTAQSIANGTSYVKLTGFTTNGLSSNCTSDATNDKITVTKTGVYYINWSMSASAGTANLIWTFTCFGGGTELAPPHSQRKITTAGDVGAFGGQGFVNITSVPYDIDLRCHHDGGSAANLTPVMANLTIQYLGE